jgi:hypothetical protein
LADFVYCVSIAICHGLLSVEPAQRGSAQTFLARALAVFFLGEKAVLAVRRSHARLTYKEVAMAGKGMSVGFGVFGHLPPHSACCKLIDETVRPHPALRIQRVPLLLAFYYALVGIVRLFDPEGAGRDANCLAAVLKRFTDVQIIG